MYVSIFFRHALIFTLKFERNELVPKLLTCIFTNRGTDVEMTNILKYLVF